MTFERYIKDYLHDVDSKNFESINYKDGCLMSGTQYLYEATADSFYKEAVLRFGEKYVSPDGLIRGFDAKEYNVDKLRFGTVLFFLYSETGDERYKKAIERLINNLRHHPRTSEGSFWHKAIYPDQVWLDGLYMAQPFYLLYDKAFDNRRNYDDITGQFLRVRKYIYSSEKGLYYHAWDEQRKREWANKETGVSPCFWLRAIGWWLMALVDCCEIMEDATNGHRSELQKLLIESVEGLLPYRDKNSGMFLQLVDLPDEKGNYPEVSGSLMVAYSLLKGIRLGLLNDEQLVVAAEEILLSVQANMLHWKEGRLCLQNICASGGLGMHPEQHRNRDGSVAYYLSEKIVPDDLHGVSTLFMAYAERIKSGRTR